MKWTKTDCFGNEQVWYSEDVINKYRNCLIEIRDLKKFNGINDDVFKMINRVLEDADE